jgi:protein-disulfide isomerase
MQEYNTQDSPDANQNMSKSQRGNQKQIASAIILSGVLIASAILLKGSKPAVENPATANGIPVTTSTLAPVKASDRTLGNQNAKVALIMYEDFQCPFCGAISGLQSNTNLIQTLKQQDPNWTPFIPGVNDYVKNGQVEFVYRDYAFLGPESVRAAEAARCAGEQGKFWEYHDYLYGHQSGENQGNFSDAHLKSFAQTLGLNTSSFNNCLDGGKYAQAVADSKNEGIAAGVTGTPKGFILSGGKIVSTIDGAESFASVKQKIDNALQ